MSVKLTILKTGETLISELQELVADKDQLSPHAYLLNNPHVVRTKDKTFLTEEEKDEKKLIKGFSSSNRVSLSRLISIIESDPSATLRIFHSIKKVPNNIYTIGITGPPGAGKSTLTNQMIKKVI